MQVFKAFYKIANKHKIPCLIYVLVFLIIIVMMSLSANKTGTSKFEARAVNIAVIDHDNSSLSKALIEYLDEKHTIVELRDYSDETLTDNLFYETINYVLTIPEGFEARFLDGKGENTLEHSMRKDNASGFFVNHQIDAYLQSISLYITGGFDLESAIHKTNTNESLQKDVEVLNFEETANKKDDIMFYFYQYYCYVILMILPIGIVPILTTFNERTMKARTICSSLSSRARNAQLGLGCVSFSLMVWVIFNILAVIAFKPSNIFSEQGLMCLSNSFMFTMISTTFTLILSAFGAKDNSLNLICNIIGLGMSFLCGVFVPQWLLGSSVLAVGKFLPAYWYIKIINMASGWSGDAYSVAAFFKYLGIEAAFFVTLFAVYLVANTQRKKNSLS